MQMQSCGQQKTLFPTCGNTVYVCHSAQGWQAQIWQFNCITVIFGPAILVLYSNFWPKYTSHGTCINHVTYIIWPAKY